MKPWYGSMAPLRVTQNELICSRHAGHGFLFQHIEDFAGEVLKFLREERSQVHVPPNDRGKEL